MSLYSPTAPLIACAIVASCRPQLSGRVTEARRPRAPAYAKHHCRGTKGGCRSPVSFSRSFRREFDFGHGRDVSVEFRRGSEHRLRRAAKFDVRLKDLGLLDHPGPENRVVEYAEGSVVELSLRDAAAESLGASVITCFGHHVVEEEIAKAITVIEFDALVCHFSSRFCASGHGFCLVFKRAGHLGPRHTHRGHPFLSPHLMYRLEYLSPPGDLFEDSSRRGGADERFWFSVMMVEVLLDGGFELGHTLEDTASDAIGSDAAEEALDFG